MKAPKATYRLQLNNDFTLNHLERAIPYLQALGIDTIYASPILQAVPSSNHGYDGIDMHVINPELGTLDQLIDLKKKLTDSGIGWLQDIVPNHMAFDTGNRWLMDVLEHGPASRYRHYFDSSLSGEWFTQEPLMVPTLGKKLQQVLDDQEIRIVEHGEKLYFRYFDQQWPLSTVTTKQIHDDFLTEKNSRKPSTSNQAGPDFKDFLGRLTASKTELHKLLKEQHYRLCHWQETDSHINFRRFFTVNGLICLQINNETVFQDTHHLLKQLLEQKVIDGLRVDHIDGIYNPTQYLRDLRQLTGPDTYIVAEKILEHTEELPAKWPIAGATGYEFLATVNNVLIDVDGKKKFTKFYEKYVGKQTSLKRQQYDKKAAILTKYMQGEVKHLADVFVRLRLDNGESQLSVKNLEHVITSFLVLFPTYRSYVEAFPCPKPEFEVLDTVYRKLKKKNPQYPLEVRLFAAACERAQSGDDPDFSARYSQFFGRCMQYTGPAMAKGVEDTLMYTYNRFLGTNEVGDHPANFGIGVEQFHAFMVNRQRHWPAALNTTATHDTKRGEDARARLQVLTACPSLWTSMVNKWHRTIAQEFTGVMPSSNDQYAIFQAIFASYPMQDEHDPQFAERLTDYLTKYLREGKENSDWAQPNEQYEETVHTFARFLLKEQHAFLPTMRKLLHQLRDFAMIHSLCQVVLKFTSPGVPDVYQGTDLWDFSFVDPDNRRPVDFDKRAQFLQDINAMQPAEQATTLWKERENGKVKLWLINRLASLRKMSESLSDKGNYVPLKTAGKYREHILAFARRHRNSWTVVILPLHLARIKKLHNSKLNDFDWGDTRVLLPTEGKICWNDCLRHTKGEGNAVSIKAVFTDIPLAVLQYDVPEKKRRAGILMAISSLPASFGIGDLGKPAQDFAHALHNAGQRYWQVLPLGPLSTEQFFSPYSTLSAMAGNPLLISLEQLAAAGLLDDGDLQKRRMKSKKRVNYAAAETLKNELLYQAFGHARNQEDKDFDDFCMQESAWLDDYALFMALRKHHHDSPWYQWPDAFKNRDPKSLQNFMADHSTDIRYEKWLQYIFFKQWRALKAYCYHLNISLLGDIPIYVGHDAADVWANPSLFSLTADGKIACMAGVPPDYFNADGQKWGMPVFRWENHQKDHFKWWLMRIKQNLKLYDKVRLDHFRAFAAYWQITMPAETAVDGEWIKAPGVQLFQHLEKTFPDMPFIAEDLGDIDDAVYALRDRYQLPGMKVLQFAFGEDMPQSVHVPHHHSQNFVVYTGTHDNNTTVGWFKNDLQEAGRKRLQSYLSSAIYAKNVADFLIKAAYASVADIAVIPMQDILSLDEKHRMNTPSSTAGNWCWQMLPEALNKKVQDRLKDYTTAYDRL
ncbi:malto-oligosyltrehalose synthase [Sphingobacterium griseoflavum]|uniref:4-alpha-glucanotransferase n=1 Tax=Sphingobacterium griseoflavum TaxID=1474952 RepID=A0ABQ3HX36_9SPHI|nr:malto-oligosyltrehalose synthase [Sphingobacterium griseoflavum]GHE33120.1 hypothetical protein GCM10017764_15230 [Sphingobacterium griseoflavum]